MRSLVAFSALMKRAKAGKICSLAIAWGELGERPIIRGTGAAAPHTRICYAHIYYLLVAVFISRFRTVESSCREDDARRCLSRTERQDK